MSSNPQEILLIRKKTPNGLKAQKRIAQGIALGIFERTSFRAMKGQKSSTTMLLPFQGESFFCHLHPGRCPGLCALCPFGARKVSWGCGLSFETFFFAAGGRTAEAPLLRETFDEVVGAVEAELAGFAEVGRALFVLSEEEACEPAVVVGFGKGGVHGDHLVIVGDGRLVVV